ncbi:heterogeneous nuclear ribonucleoprotein Q [Tanacetum coccineum]
MVQEGALTTLAAVAGSSQVRLVKNKDNNESNSFAFLAYGTTDVAQKMIKKMHSKEYKFGSAKSAQVLVQSPTWNHSEIGLARINPVSALSSLIV